MSITKIVPGQVHNNGITDGSIPITVPQLATYPCNFPVLAMVTPKGPLGQKYINTGDYANIYGNVQDTETPYYNVISALIHSLALGGQASLGMRRLTANKQVSRSAIGVKVIKQDIQQYKRDNTHHFVLDESGRRQPITDGDVTYAGYTFEHVILKSDHLGWSDGVGALKNVNGEEDGKQYTIYPLYELPSGIGDHYNQMGHFAGIPNNADWNGISEFVNRYGVYPYTMKLYELTKSGLPVLAKTLVNTEETSFTLFNMKDAQGVRYGLNTAIGNYTGASSNRPIVPRPAPFTEAHVYQNNLELLTKLVLETEMEVKPELLVYLDGVEPHKQINILTGVNHEGVPYYTLEIAGETRLFNLNSQLNSFGGISPFLNDEGKFIKVDGYSEDYWTETYDFSENPDPAKKTTLTRRDAWKITQELLLADLMSYRNSLEMKDWTRNRQSIIFDVGYNTAVKDELIQLLNVRKDQVAIFSDSEWLENYSIEQRYSTRQYLTNRLRLTPESTQSGTPASRAMIVMWSLKKIDEESGEDMPHVLDLATKFAQFGGNAEGRLLRQFCPDHGDNRIVSTMYGATVEIEDDELGASNFELGAVTLRPYNQTQLYRPALPSIYPHNDSVLKDFVTNFTAINAEKIIADSWTLVSGDTTISAEDYASIVKDSSEERIRDNLGAMIADARVEPSYNEGAPNGRSILNATGYLAFNKGKYMMNMSLVALNEQDLGQEG